MAGHNIPKDIFNGRRIGPEIVKSYAHACLKHGAVFSNTTSSSWIGRAWHLFDKFGVDRSDQCSYTSLAWQENISCQLDSQRKVVAWRGDANPEALWQSGKDLQRTAAFDRQGIESVCVASDRGEGGGRRRRRRWRVHVRFITVLDVLYVSNYEQRIIWPVDWSILRSVVGHTE